MVSKKYFYLPASLDSSDLLSAIKESFQLIPVIADSKRIVLFDTFDWRLYKRNLILLFKPDHSIVIEDLFTGQALHEGRCGTRNLPRFWWEFHDSGIKPALKKYIGVRALIKLIEFKEYSDFVDILNGESGAVAGIAFKKLAPIGLPVSDTRLDFIEVISHPGHEHESTFFHDTILQHGCLAFTEHPYLVLLKNIGIDPGGYTSNINILLKPDEDCLTSIRKFLEQTLAVYRQNMAGIKDDIDTEFLHDFRVAIRRTRSVITQIPDVFPNEISSDFAKDLRYFQQASNRLRDIDVYLLNKDYYFEMLPEKLAPGAAHFFETLEKKRKRELRGLIGALNSDRNIELMSKWESLTKWEPDTGSPLTNATRPVIEVARQYILRRYNKILKIGIKIDKHKSDGMLHTLRIQCKKLRYLLECFSSLFPEKDIDLFIKHLKKLQDTLGEYNDLIVQQAELQRHLSRITVKGKKELKEAAAVGGLISVLGYRQNPIRNSFKSVFEEFTGPENTELFHRLFDRLHNMIS